MRKLQFIIFFVIYLLTTVVNFGQTKQGKKLNSNDKNNSIKDSPFKFDAIEQALKNLKEKDTTGIPFSIIDYEPIKHYRSEKEMYLLLQKYNLNNDSILYYGTENEDPEIIYKKSNKLRERIDKKFGVNFIDSLRNIAEKQYVQNNINKLFDYNDCDTVSRYAGAKYYEDFFDILNLDFWKVVKYPKDFIYRNEKDLYSYMNAEFILHKDGKVSDIKTGVTFQNNQNNKYSIYFRKKLIKFIKKSKWIPAKSIGITVTSKVPLTIHFK